MIERNKHPFHEDVVQRKGLMFKSTVHMMRHVQQTHLQTVSIRATESTTPRRTGGCLVQRWLKNLAILNMSMIGSDLACSLPSNMPKNRHPSVSFRSRHPKASIATGRFNAKLLMPGRQDSPSEWRIWTSRIYWDGLLPISRSGSQSASLLNLKIETRSAP